MRSCYSPIWFPKMLVKSFGQHKLSMKYVCISIYNIPEKSRCDWSDTQHRRGAEHKCILTMSKHCPPLALIMQMKNCLFGAGTAEAGVICFKGNPPQPGSRMLLINTLIGRQPSGLKSFHSNHYSLPNERWWLGGALHLKRQSWWIIWSLFTSFNSKPVIRRHSEEACRSLFANAASSIKS